MQGIFEAFIEILIKKQIIKTKHFKTYSLFILKLPEMCSKLKYLYDISEMP